MFREVDETGVKGEQTRFYLKLIFDLNGCQTRRGAKQNYIYRGVTDESKNHARASGGVSAQGKGT